MELVRIGSAKFQGKPYLARQATTGRVRHTPTACTTPGKRRGTIEPMFHGRLQRPPNRPAKIATAGSGAAKGVISVTSAAGSPTLDAIGQGRQRGVGGAGRVQKPVTQRAGAHKG